MEISTSQEFKDRLSKAQKPVVAYFSASWCGPCRVYRPRVEEVAGQLEDEAVFLSVDVDASPDLVEAYGIQSVPTIIYINAEDKPLRLIGPKSLDDLTNFVKGTTE